MGVILSLAVATKSIKKSRDKKKAARRKEKVDPQGVQPPFSPAQADCVEGLGDEHLAVVPPGGVGTAEVERSVAVEAPLPLSIDTKADTQLSTPPTKGAESKDKMASDEDYAAFLDKANADPNEGVAKTRTSNKVALKAVDHGVEIPAALTKATEDTFYVSDADEPFEPVCLKLGGKGKGILPDEVTFAKLVHHPSPEDADVTILDIGEWDPSGQYKDIVDATRAATKGSDVRVYRISAGGPRVEYYLVGIDGEKLVGVKALAVES